MTLPEGIVEKSSSLLYLGLGVSPAKESLISICRPFTSWRALTAPFPKTLLRGE